MMRCSAAFAVRTRVRQASAVRFEMMALALCTRLVIVSGVIPTISCAQDGVKE